MNKIEQFTIACALLIAPAQAGAAESLTDAVSVFSADSSTLSRYITVRPGLTSFSYENNSDNTKSSVTDIHPFSGSFRLSAGLLQKDQDTVSSLKNSAIENRHSDYAIHRMDTLSQDPASFSQKPYVGFGWGLSPDEKGNWFINLDLGIMYQGNDCTGSDVERCSQLNNTSADKLSVQDGLEKYGWFPVLSGGVTFKF
ncbi:hypothetical protein JWG39_01630 [Desulforhopalus vacuolatus]|uniref:hypothetical protein n=1 Tax=Desulforhopalus vacuolatus TaxID=40414 RepID=UPI0019645025|nr:hypothetical protein [Desulforhopalus vacuolatus]MBM9518514.1 hypothetical protein [Desulforhopalus vacuolatus]